MPETEAWARTDAALRVIERAFNELHDRKPDKKDLVAMKLWEFEHREVEVWAHSIGARRFALVKR